jgi:hypothetical protein
MVMSPIGDSNRSWNSARDNLAARRLCLQKPSAASGLRPGPEGDGTPGDSVCENCSGETLRRSGTGTAVPERHADAADAPHLTSAFVAQLLGQIIPDTSTDRLEARAAYKFDEAIINLALDTRL